MTRWAAWLERWLLLLIIVFAALGLVWPAPARHAAAAHGITIALVVLVAAVGSGLDASAVADARRYARRAAVMIIVPGVVLPLIALAAGYAVPDGPLRLGVLAAGTAPSEVASVALVTLAGGSSALSASVLIGSTFFSVFFAGPILQVLAGHAGSFSSTSLLISLIEIVALPLIVAVAARTRVPAALHESVDALGSVVATLAVLVLIWLVAGQVNLGLSYLRAGVALALFLAGSSALATALTTGLPRAVGISFGLPVAMRDFAIAAGIATQAFGAAASAPLGIYGVLVLLLGAAVARRGARRPQDANSTPAAEPKGSRPERR